MAIRIVQNGFSQQFFRIAENNEKQIVEVVGDARRQPTHSLHLVFLPESAFLLLADRRVAE